MMSVDAAESMVMSEDSDSVKLFLGQLPRDADESFVYEMVVESLNMNDGDANGSVSNPSSTSTNVSSPAGGSSGSVAGSGSAPSSPTNRVAEVAVLRDRRTAVSRGCAFVTFVHRADGDMIVARLNNSRVLPGASHPVQVKYADGELERLEPKLVIERIPVLWSESDVSAMVASAAGVSVLREVAVIRLADGRSKGAAYVRCTSRVDARHIANALDGLQVESGETLVVRWIQSPHARHPFVHHGHHHPGIHHPHGGGHRHPHHGGMHHPHHLGVHHPHHLMALSHGMGPQMVGLGSHPLPLPLPHPLPHHPFNNASANGAPPLGPGAPAGASGMTNIGNPNGMAPGMHGHPLMHHPHPTMHHLHHTMVPTHMQMGMNMHHMVSYAGGSQIPANYPGNPSSSSPASSLSSSSSSTSTAAAAAAVTTTSAATSGGGGASLASGPAVPGASANTAEGVAMDGAVHSMTPPFMHRPLHHHGMQHPMQHPHHPMMVPMQPHFVPNVLSGDASNGPVAGMGTMGSAGGTANGSIPGGNIDGMGAGVGMPPVYMYPSMGGMAMPPPLHPHAHGMGRPHGHHGHPHHHSSSSVGSVSSGSTGAPAGHGHSGHVHGGRSHGGRGHGHGHGHNQGQGQGQGQGQSQGQGQGQGQGGQGGQGQGQTSTPQIEGPPGANLFIYHIPPAFTDTEIGALFAPYGHVLSAKVFVDKQSGLSKGFGFVSYDAAPAAQAAIAAMSGFSVANKRLKVQLKKDKIAGSDVSQENHVQGSGDAENGNDEPEDADSAF
eukprot:ANDGO_03674.mRNA.1 RNA-binding protein BRN2